MIDIHSHILPGLDDGPKSLTQSLEMAQMYEICGYSHVVATPHYIHGTAWAPSAEVIREKIGALENVMKRSGMGLSVLPGSEIALDPEVPGLIQKRRLQPLSNSSYFLIEPPFVRLPPGWKDILFSIAAAGQNVILAHPERCPEFLKNPVLLDDLVMNGIYLQVNIGSLLGLFFPDAKDLALRLAEKGFIHILATDSHDGSKRGCDFSRQHFDFLGKILGQENIRLLMWENPRRLLNDQPLKTMRPPDPGHTIEEKRGGFFSRIFGKLVRGAPAHNLR